MIADRTDRTLSAVDCFQVPAIQGARWSFYYSTRILPVGIASLPPLFIDSPLRPSGFFPTRLCNLLPTLFSLTEKKKKEKYKFSRT